MGRSRRKLKRNAPKVKVGLPSKRRATNRLLKAQTLILPDKRVVEWDAAATLGSNYEAAGFAVDPNKAVIRGNKTAAAAAGLASADIASFQVREDGEGTAWDGEGGHKASTRLQREAEGKEDKAQKKVLERRPRPLDALDSNEALRNATGGEGTLQEKLEEDQELLATLGQRPRGGVRKLERLTKMQRTHISRLLHKHGLNYEAMARDLKLNKLQQTVGALKFLCARFLAHEPAPPGMKAAGAATASAAAAIDAAAS